MPKPQALIMLGNIGSGKTAQAELLKDHIDGFHLSVGSLIRQNLTNDSHMIDGELVSHRKVTKIVQKATSAVDPAKPIIFDGFPRAIKQKKWLDKHLKKLDRTLVKVFYLVVDDSEIDKRLAKRERIDDTPESIEQRKQVFLRSVIPVIESYKHEGLVEEINGNEDPRTVQQQIKKSISQYL